MLIRNLRVFGSKRFLFVAVDAVVTARARVAREINLAQKYGIRHSLREIFSVIMVLTSAM